MKNFELVSYINYLIQNNRLLDFYHSVYWRNTRKKVLILDHYECQDCKEKGKLTKAILVHHVKEVKLYPMYALSLYILNEKGEQERNLVSLCFNCHELRHNRCFQSKNKAEKFLNEEWW